MKNPPAFLNAEDHKIADAFEWTAGMTLRDYFAAKSITGICFEIWSNGDNHAAEYAKRAYQLADAMIAEREKPL